MSLFGKRIPPEREPVAQIQVVDHEPHSFYANEANKPSGAAGSSTMLPQTRDPDYLKSLFDVGIFRDTIAPSFALHSGLSIIAWGIGRSTDRVEAKDWLCMFLMSPRS